MGIQGNQENRKMTATFRVYSQNVCILPVGGREAMLQRSSFVGTLILLSSFGIAAYCDCDLRLLACVALLLLRTSLFCPLGFFLASPMWVTSNLYADDLKSERLAALADRLSSSSVPLYDVVLLQEFFGCFYSDRHRQYFVEVMRGKGYMHCAMPPCTLSQTFPSLWGNSGLAIFSPHPLSDSTFQTFKHQLFYDKWLVNRGILGAKVHIPGGPVLDAYSVHFGPPVSVLTMFWFVPTWAAELVDVFDCQTAELVSLIRSRAGGLRALVGGDFNAAVNSKSYLVLKAKLASIEVMNTGPNFELHGAKPTANPPGETLLTRGLRTPKVLDYIFASSELGKGRKVSCIVGDMRCFFGGREHMISDHAPVESTFELVRKPSTPGEAVFDLSLDPKKTD